MITNTMSAQCEVVNCKRVDTVALLGLLAIVLTGCTTVSITEQGGATYVERHFGVVSIELSPTTDAVVAEVNTLGYLAGPMGVSLGVGHASFAALPADCRLVVWLEHPDQIETLRRLLEDRTDVCVINQKEEERSP